MKILLPIFCLSLHMTFITHIFILGLKLIGNKEKNDLIEKLDEKQKKIYEEIIKERRNHYLIGLVLGIIISILYNLYYGKNIKQMTCAYLGIATLIANHFYLLMPKKNWMIEHLDEKEDILAWNNVYKKMRYLTTYSDIVGFIIFVMAQYFI